MPEWKEVITQKKETLFYKKGERIFSEGEKVSGVFFLFTGAVKMYYRCFSWFRMKKRAENLLLCVKVEKN